MGGLCRVRLSKAVHPLDFFLLDFLQINLQKHPIEEISMDLLSIFNLQNPWREPNYKFPAQVYIRRDMLSELINHLAKREISILVGARQVGKTFLLQRLIRHLLSNSTCLSNQIFYFNFDALELVEFVQKDKEFSDFLELYGEKDKRAFVFFDEY